MVEIFSDPETYAKAAVTHPTEAAANESAQAFANDVAEARLKHGISDFVLIFAAKVAPNVVRCHVAARGMSANFAELGAAAYRAFTLPEVERLRRLTDYASGASDNPPKGQGDG